MSEGRKTQVILLDDRRLDLLVQPKLYSTELLDIVASHFGLKEKEYFGISFKDETGHHHWLHLDRKVLEHEFPKKTGPLVLYFGVRFFIESIGYLRDNATIELFFLQAKQAVFKAHLEVDSETAFELAAHVLQASYGDHTEDDIAKKQLKKLPVLPTSVLREHPSIGYCEDQVLGHYRKLEGHTRGSAIVNYMTIIESIPTYGIHFYEVKDKSSIPWWLGLSYKGISLYDYADKRVPRKVFAWKQLENLYFRDKKFSIEVHDPKRIVHTLSSFNLYEDAIQEPLDEFDDLSDAISDPTTQVSVSRRTFGPGNVNVHAWFASTPLLTKCIWSMAVSQHQFYLDRKQSKSQLPQVRSMSEIATDLCHSSSSLHSGSAATSGSISRSNSAHSLTLSTYNSKTELGTDFSVPPVSSEELEASRAAQREMFQALQARKEALEEALRKKTEELKAICLKEGELTGVLPIEMPLVPGEPLPQIRRRVGTSFALSPKFMNQDKASEAEEALAQLELDLDLQDKIAKAAYKLAQDKSVARSVRKQRKQQYHRASQRLKDIEKKLNEYRERIGRIPLRLQNSMEDLSEDSREFLDSEPEFISPVGSPAVQRPNSREGYQHPYIAGNQRVLSNGSPGQTVVAPQHKSAPASPVRQPHGAPRGSTPSPNTGRHQSGRGYIPNSVYSTRTSYRNQMYPTYSTKDHSAGSQSDYENSSRTIPPVSNRHVSRIDRENYRNETSHNLYNVNEMKTTCYDSTDELKSPASEECDSYCSDQEGGRWQGAHHQGDPHHRAYGSLDRNTHPNMMLQELSPSKFGSKRESHSDYRDSPYQIVDMPPLPRGHAEPLREMPANGYGRLYEQGGEDPHGDNSSHNTSIPYIDCSQSSISVPGSETGAWYDPSRQAGQFESPPPSSFSRPEAPGYERAPSQQYHGAPPHSYGPQSEAGYYKGTRTQTDSQYQSPPNPDQQRMTVTKYQSYVEVSKPFEMSDFYKYSERLRRQRVQDSPPSSVASDSTAPSPHHPPPQSFPVSRTQHPHPSQAPVRPQAPYRGHMTSHSGYASSTGSRSRPSSPYSQHSYQDSQPYSKNNSSPYSSSSGPLTAAQSSIVQTNAYKHMPTSQHSSSSYQQHSPKHVAYQPPKPMTCEPIRDSLQGSTPASSGKNLTHRQV